MNKIQIFLCVLAGITLTNCETEERFPLSKRYWDIKDYEEVVNELKFGYKSDEKLPTLDNPETRLIVEKLTDQQNFNIVLNDKELGMSYKNEVAEAFFKRWRLLTSVYDKLDRKDNYIYDKEMLAVYHFGLGLQLRYFELGNEEIKENADDPNSDEVKLTTDSNVNILVKNFTAYLDYVNEEKRFSEKGQKIYAEGMKTYFTKLIDRYPETDYSTLKRKVDLMLKKTKVTPIKSELSNLNELLIENMNRKKEKEDN